MILHYVFIGVYIAGILGIIFAVVYVYHQRNGASHRHGNWNFPLSKTQEKGLPCRLNLGWQVFPWFIDPKLTLQPAYFCTTAHCLNWKGGYGEDMKLRPGATYAIRSNNSSTLGLVVCNAAFRT